jgi:protein-S-isoprenylcysteine O-methyltransferase Ste14
MSSLAIIDSAFVGLWLIFIAYWAVSALSPKRNVGRNRSWPREIGLRVGVAVLIITALRLPLAGAARGSARALLINTSLPRGIIGLAVCALGIALAIWARFHLGRNWGTPMSRKQNPDLITTGPYAVIRHPIYAGMLVAMLGCTIGQSVLWLAPLVVAGAYFVFSAETEEKAMLRKFPTAYRAYRDRTKMLVPFVF